MCTFQHKKTFSATLLWCYLALLCLWQTGLIKWGWGGGGGGSGVYTVSTVYPGCQSTFPKWLLLQNFLLDLFPTWDSDGRQQHLGPWSFLRIQKLVKFWNPLYPTWTEAHYPRVTLHLHVYSNIRAELVRPTGLLWDLTLSGPGQCLLGSCLPLWSNIHPEFDMEMNIQARKFQINLI